MTTQAYPAIFDELDYFSPSEKWGDPWKVNGILLALMDEIRERIGVGIVIHCAYEKGGHAQRSQHYLGNAVDFHVVGMPFHEAVYWIEKILEDLHVADWVGLGIYPEWNTPGFHLDVRGTRARWGVHNGEYIAYDFIKENYVRA